MANAPAVQSRPAAPPALPPAMTTALAELDVDPNQCNILAPTQSFGRIIGKFQKLIIEKVILNPDYKNGKDVYPPGGTGLALSGLALTKMAQACGVQWSAKYTTNLESTPEKSRAKATGAMQMPNGQWVVWSNEKTVEMEALEEEIELQMEKDHIFKGRDDLEFRRRRLTKRKFKDELAMSGAMNRVIRRLLTIQSTYTPQEIRRPFLVPRVVTDMDKVAADPQMREVALRSLDDSAGRVFGEGPDRGEDAIEGGDGATTLALGGPTEPVNAGSDDLGDVIVEDFVDDDPGAETEATTEEAVEGFPPSDPKPAAADSEAAAQPEPSEAQVLIGKLEKHQDHDRLNDKQKAYVKRVLAKTGTKGGYNLDQLRTMWGQVAEATGEK